MNDSQFEYPSVSLMRQLKRISISCIGIIVVAAAMIQAVPSGVSLATFPIDSGFGATGPYGISTDSIAHPKWRGHFVYLFYPIQAKERVPTIFFCHGIGADNPQIYLQLIYNIVSHGYAVVYSPFKKDVAFKSPPDAYDQMWRGIEQSIRQWRSKLDTTRVGFVGHSYGAGAIPSFAWNASHEKAWGRNGLFLYMMAPWYSYNINQQQFAQFPETMKCIVEIFENDKVNDHRMAIDLFRSISIPETNKEFITLCNDTCGNEILNADHSVPDGTYRFGWNVNALDYYGVYRLIHALAVCTFANDTIAEKIALGKKNAAHCYMGEWWNGKLIRKCKQSDAPLPMYPQSLYINFWNHVKNPRAQIPQCFGSTKTADVGTSVTIQNYKAIIRFRHQIESETIDSSTSQPVFSPEPGTDTDGAMEKSTNGSNKVDFTILPPKEGFGTKGCYSVKEVSFPHPSGGSGDIFCYSPQPSSRRFPIILFAPKLSSSGQKYRQLLTHIASQGYIVIYSTYRLRPLMNDAGQYNALMAGYDAAIEMVRTYIDTTRIGFVGHSYGAGAIPAVSWEYLVKKHWGYNGSFLFLMSPSYVHCFTQAQFSSFPQTSKLVVQVYEDDHFNDFRIAEDIFYSIYIHPSDKEFLVVNNVCNGAISYDAEYQLPEGEDEEDIEDVEPLFKYAVCRPIDALAKYTFEGDALAKKIALGNGCPEEVFMGYWPDGKPVNPMYATDVPTVHNLKWQKHNPVTILAGLINPIWPITMFSSFDDKRNERRKLPVP